MRWIYTPVCVWCGHPPHRSGCCRAVVRLIAVEGHPEMPCICSAPREEPHEHKR